MRAIILAYFFSMLLWRKFLDALFAPVCLVCGGVLSSTDAGKNVCGNCVSGVVLNSGLMCPSCRRRLSALDFRGHRHANFLLGAATDYVDPVIQKLIWQLKYKYKDGACIGLSAFLIHYVLRENLGAGLAEKDFLVVPIPLHRRRLRERGFNQSDKIGALFAGYFNLSLASGMLERVRATDYQAQVRGGLKARQANVAGCFALVDSEAARGRNIILIDDVYTTGATLAEAANVLKKAGAKEIFALVAAGV